MLDINSQVIGQVSLTTKETAFGDLIALRKNHHQRRLIFYKKQSSLCRYTLKAYTFRFTAVPWGSEFCHNVV